MIYFNSIFLNPSSIFFVPYLISGILISLFWLKFSQRQTLRQALLFLFNPKVWLTRQTGLEVLISIFMLLGLVKLMRPLEEFIYNGILSLQDFFAAPSARLVVFSLNPVVESIFVTLIVMLAYDFASYWTHRFMHANDLFWRVHAFHHSAQKLTFFTTYRQHPLEPLILATTRTSISALALVVFHYFFPASAEVITVLGLGVGFFIYMFTVNLHHSPVPVTYPKALRKIFISPHVHHLHHSLDTENDRKDSGKDSGKNYGVIFSFWDRSFNTYQETH